MVIQDKKVKLSHNSLGKDLLGYDAHEGFYWIVKGIAEFPECF